MRRHTLLLTIAMGLMGSAAGQDDAPLGGPPVDASATAPTLIERDYEGRLRKLERRPEIAALDMLGLTDTELAPANEVVDERAALIEKIVFNNLLLLGEVGTALETAPPGAGMEAVEPDLRERFEAALGPLWMGTPLVDQIQDALPEHARVEYRRIVDTWYAAAMEQARLTNPDAPASPYELVMRDVVGGEVESAYERGQAGRDQAYEEFLAALELDPETEGRVREAALDAYLEILNDTGREPTQAEEALIFRKMLAVIPEEDHPRVWRAVFRMGMDEQGAD